MAEYRTLKRSFWNDPFIEELAPAGKLLYVYLLTCPHTSNLGLLEVARRRLAYETGLPEESVASLLAHMESQGKIVMDGNSIWLVKFIRHQASTSPRLLQSLRKLFGQLKSVPLRKAICQEYPDLFGAPDTAPFAADTAATAPASGSRPAPADTAATAPASGSRPASADTAASGRTAPDSRRTPDRLSRPAIPSLHRENIPCAYPMHTLSIPCQEKEREREEEKEKEYLSPSCTSQRKGGYARAYAGQRTEKAAADRQPCAAEQGRAGQIRKATDTLSYETTDDKRSCPPGEAPRQTSLKPLSERHPALTGEEYRLRGSSPRTQSGNNPALTDTEHDSFRRQTISPQKTALTDTGQDRPAATHPDAGTGALSEPGTPKGQTQLPRLSAPPFSDPATGRAARQTDCGSSGHAAPPFTGTTTGQTPRIRTKQPGTERNAAPARARPAENTAGTPRLDFVELREFYTREIRPEGELDGYAEFQQLIKTGHNFPGIHALMDDLAARKAAGVWNAGYEIGLARYLKTHGWTAPLRPAGSGKAHSAGRLVPMHNEPRAMTEYQKQRQDRRKLAAFLLAERGGYLYGDAACDCNTTMDGQTAGLAGSSLQYRTLPGRTGTAG